jgi:DNA-binding NtrC family response regulator
MRNDRTLLHLDDDPATLRLVGQALAEHGFRTTPLSSPRQLAISLPRRQERVVLMDVALAEMDGLDLLQRIKAFDGGIQVIALTDYVPMTTVMDLMRCGAEACFFKPLVDFNPLIQAVTCSFRKIERWWQTLDELSSRKRLSPEELPRVRSPLAQPSEFCRAELIPLAAVNFGA